MPAMGLFEEDGDAEAQARWEAVTPMVDGLNEAVRLFDTVNKEPLAETQDALKRIPEMLLPQVEAVAAKIFRDEFLRLAASRRNDAKSQLDPSNSVNVLAHSAKLAAFSAVGYLSSSPWHLADDALLKRIARDLEGAQDFDAADKHLWSVRCVNLFVAASDSDDRDSYLKAAKALVRRHSVHNLVLDGELAEWLPDVEFQMACRDVGLRPLFVGIADRRDASKHSMLRPETSPAMIPALFVDTKGQQLSLGASGEVLLPQSAPRPAAAPVAAPAPQLPAQPARQEAVPASAPAQPRLPQGGPTPPPTAMRDRIQAMREKQGRRLGARP